MNYQYTTWEQVKHQYLMILLETFGFKTETHIAGAENVIT